MENQNQTKWYDKTWLVVVLCFVFFPVGLYALWKNSSIGKGWKIGVTAFFALIVIANIGSKDKNELTTDVKEASVESNLTQAQKDSITQVEKLAELENRKNQTISANSLIQNYSDNEVRADENFKGKTFFVEGRVSDIKKDILDDIYVTLETQDVIRQVQCYFEDKETAAKLEKGIKVTFQGRCDGLLMNVLMKDCKLVDNLEDLEGKK